MTAGPGGRRKRFFAAMERFHRFGSRLDTPGEDSLYIQGLVDIFQALGHRVSFDDDARCQICHLFLTGGEQSASAAPASLPYFVSILKECSATSMADSTDILGRASRIFVESTALATKFLPDTALLKKHQVLSLPYPIPRPADPNLFHKASNVGPFILCHGAIRPENNQHLLLEALADVPITLVLSSANLQSDKTYLDTLRRYKGRVSLLIPDSWTSDLLASAFAACACHALVSERHGMHCGTYFAAQSGKNFVASHTDSLAVTLGAFTAPSNLGASNLAELKNALLAAFHSPCQTKVSDAIKRVQLQNHARSLLRLYHSALRLQEIEKTDNAGHPDFETEILEADRKLRAGAVQACLDTLHAVKAKSLSAATREQATLLEAAAFRRHGHMLIARQKYEAVLVQSPSSAKARAGKGWVALESGHTEEADRLFREALTIDPLDDEALCGAGVLLAAAHDITQAYLQFEKAVQTNPDNRLAQSFRFKIATPSGEPMAGKAKEALMAYLLRHPEDSELAALLAGSPK